MNTRLDTEESLRDLCRNALSALEDSFGLPPNQLGQRIDRVENRVVMLRDGLIDRYRKEDRSAGASVWRDPLDRANLALALVACVEYPATGLHRSYLKDAQKVLKDLRQDLMAL